MSIPKDVYPLEFDGPIGIVKCCVCDLKLCQDTEAIQADWDNDFYCKDCHAEMLEDIKIEAQKDYDELIENEIKKQEERQ